MKGTIKKRIDYIDVAKGIGILCIVVGHCLTKGTVLRRWLFVFHVPYFFIVTGIIFKKEEARKFIKDKFMRLMIPYYIAGILSIFIYLIIGHYKEIADEQYLRFIPNIATLVYGNSRFGYMQWNNPLWNVPCFFAVVIIFNFILNKIGKAKRAKMLLLLVCALSWCVGYLTSNILSLWLPLQLETALAMLIFISVGYTRSNENWGGQFIQEPYYQHRYDYCRMCIKLPKFWRRRSNRYIRKYCVIFC